ncbi:isochorismatase family protein [Pseudoclavibacter chungangensis]|uniref:Isochorismatase family protein n=2 Tax=Pseudoclavibacter chungangensis TaxID=587635 RepID=A0A7J5BQW6_9MICO|nr:isochorismatase family protein [Pseudoclavibacter chungangensis]
MRNEATSGEESSHGDTVLVVIDVQTGFEDAAYWGSGMPNDAVNHVSRLLADWAARDRGPVVVVRHDSRDPASPLHPSGPGNALVPAVADAAADLLVVKHVNSAFLGEPSLDVWLRGAGLSRLVLCGIQTNMCVETTARMGGNLGYDVTVVLDATTTFDLVADVPGLGRTHVPAAELARTTAVNLAAGGFARVSDTASVLAE